MKRKPCIALAAVSLCSSITIAACSTSGPSDQPSFSAQSVPESDAEVAAETASPSTSGSTTTNKSSEASEPEQECSNKTSQEALDEAFPQLPPNRFEYAKETAGQQYWDPCLDLSYMGITISSPTVSSPSHIMLFHKGEYVGTATAEPQGFSPSITRRSKDTLDIKFTYPREGESNAGRTGKTFFTVRWDSEENKVIGTGELPPHP